VSQLIKLCSFVGGVGLSHADEQILLARPQDGETHVVLLEAGRAIKQYLGLGSSFPLCKASRDGQQYAGPYRATPGHERRIRFPSRALR
jgi:hypothetical protein